MKIPRIDADEQGVSHLGVLDVPEHEARFGPPHNAPRPYVGLVLAGEGEMAASDGETLRLRAGKFICCDAVSGQTTRPGRSPTFAWPSSTGRDLRDGSAGVHQIACGQVQEAGSVLKDSSSADVCSWRY
jgi:hypothetical protein